MGKEAPAKIVDQEVRERDGTVEIEGKVESPEKRPSKIISVGEKVKRKRPVTESKPSKKTKKNTKLLSFDDEEDQ